MPLQAPDWLTQRGGNLRLGTDNRTWFIFFSDNMDYSLTTTPVGDKFGIVLRQTNNARRLDCPETYASEDDALRAGLECLRKQMGWA
jgi:hypothetical protein